MTGKKQTDHTQKKNTGCLLLQVQEKIQVSQLRFQRFYSKIRRKARLGSKKESLQTKRGKENRFGFQNKVVVE